MKILTLHVLVLMVPPKSLETHIELPDDMGHKQSRAGPCLYYLWNAKYELEIWASWIDNNLCIGSDDIMANKINKLAEQYDVDDIRELEEYV